MYVHIRPDGESIIWCVYKVSYSGSSFYQVIHVILFPTLKYRFRSLYSFPFWSCLDGNNPNYIGTRVVHLCLCHVTQTIAYFSIPTINVSIFSHLSWWHKCQLWVPSLRKPPKDVSYRSLIRTMLSDYRCGSHLCPNYIMSHICFAPYYAPELQYQDIFYWMNDSLYTLFI